MLVEGLTLFGSDLKKLTEHVGTRSRIQVYQRVLYLEKTTHKVKPEPAAEVAKVIEFAGEI